MKDDLPCPVEHLPLRVGRRLQEDLPFWKIFELSQDRFQNFLLTLLDRLAVGHHAEIQISATQRAIRIGVQEIETKPSRARQFEPPVKASPGSTSVTGSRLLRIRH